GADNRSASAAGPDNFFTDDRKAAKTGCRIDVLFDPLGRNGPAKDEKKHRCEEKSPNIHRCDSKLKLLSLKLGRAERERNELYGHRFLAGVSLGGRRRPLSGAIWRRRRSRILYIRYNFFECGPGFIRGRNDQKSLSDFGREILII